jgi:hypothetical protein
MTRAAIFACALVVLLVASAGWWVAKRMGLLP